jgi:hypothetical protein
MTNGRVVHCRSSMVLVGFLTLMVGNCLVSPSEVIIHTSTDLEGD